MNAIELSKEYYSEILEPSIREFCPDCLNRIAVGLFGDGSQCLGYDDEVSRDHDWGIRVCILLRRHDYELFANRLRIVISEAPQEYRGYETSWHWLVQRGGVLEILPWFRGLLGDRAIPVKPLDWLSIKEHELLSATNGEIWYDPLGEVTALRARLGRYPEDIWKKRLVQRCAEMSQSHSNVRRSITRHEYVAANLAKSYFAVSLMRCWFLLGEVYAPFYKWLHRAFRDLKNVSGKTADFAKQLVTESSVHASYQIMEQMITEVKEVIEKRFPQAASCRELHEIAYVINDTIASEEVKAAVDIWDEVPT